MQTLNIVKHKNIVKAFYYLSISTDILKRIPFITWWCHGMESLSTLLACCEGSNPSLVDSFTKGLVMQSFDVLFIVNLNK